MSNRRQFALAAAGLLLPLARAGRAEPHAHHHHATPPDIRRSVSRYAIPALTLVREDGRSVFLPDELNDGRALVLNFIFTSCTAICPVTSQVFAELQQQLGAQRGKVRLVSISIDPLHDTPAVLQAYAERFARSEDWRFYTGTPEASIAAQQAFGVYRGDKMNHMPVTLLRTQPAAPWIRLEGFATAAQLLEELRPAIAAN